VRPQELGVWLLVALATAGLIGAAVAGFDIGEITLVILLTIPMLIVAQRLATDLDRSWLPRYVMLGFAAKMLGSALRFGVLEFLYLREGDAVLYHNSGIQLAEVWRAFQVPSMQGSRGAGTRFIEVLTGFLYAPHTQDIFGGFILFAALAFLGQLLFYAAFRRAFPNGRLKLYAILIFFLPNLVFWPSSIGKDAVMVLFIGVAAYGAVRLYEAYRFRWILVFGLGVAGAAVIRPHLGATILLAFSLAALLARGPAGGWARTRMVTMLVLGGVSAVLVFTVFADRFGLSLESLELDPFLDELTRRTGQGGSAVEGEAIRGPGDVPAATLRVLFRPLLFEVPGILGLLSGVEGTLLLLFVVWKLPSMVKNRRILRSAPYAMFSLLYVIGFVIVFSPVLNLGIMTRQRSQLLPILLALIVALGWPPSVEDEDATKMASGEPLREPSPASTAP
jgi:hypothetical protein